MSLQFSDLTIFFLSGKMFTSSWENAIAKFLIPLSYLKSGFDT